MPDSLSDHVRIARFRLDEAITRIAEWAASQSSEYRARSLEDARRDVERAQKRLFCACDMQRQIAESDGTDVEPDPPMIISPPPEFHTEPRVCVQCGKPGEVFQTDELIWLCKHCWAKLGTETGKD